MMKIFYSGYSRKKDVPSTNPVEADQSEASDVLWNLDFEGGFVGIELRNNWVLQILNEEDHYYAEFLDRNNMDTISTNLNIEDSDKLIKGVFESFEPQDLIERIMSDWKKGNLNTKKGVMSLPLNTKKRGHVITFVVSL